MSEFEKVKEKYGPMMKALQDIRDKRLFRERHKTFEEYVRDKWPGEEGEYMLKMLAEWEAMLSEHN
jgi:hypothetical protein